MVELARQLRRPSRARPDLGRGVRCRRSRFPARRSGEARARLTERAWPGTAAAALFLATATAGVPVPLYCMSARRNPKSGLGRSMAMDIRKTVMLVEEIKREYGAPAREKLRRVAIAAVFTNPLAGAAAGADLKPLIDYSIELGASLTPQALAALGASPAQLRAYTKAALVGIGGDLEHGAAMIHPQLGMAMRRAIRRGRVIIPGHAKVGPAGTGIDLLYGPIDEGWDLDAFDSTPVLIHDAPRPDEIVLWIGYAVGPRVNARSKGPDQKDVDALVASFRR